MNTKQYTQVAINNTQLVIDIETMANKSVIDLLPEPSISSVLKDPEKIKLAQEKARQEQIDKMALNPLTGQIACVGVYNDSKQDVYIDSEVNMLDAIYEDMISHQIITYNGLNFDIPYIFKRGIINNCKWASLKTMKQFTDKFKSQSKHIDLMNEWCIYGQYEKLDNLGSFILGQKKIEFDFKEIPGLLKTDDGKEKLKAYCLRDCELTWKLAKRMGF